ncbi:hypothetical protein NQ317_005844 [Molorchus minor]|uniref:Nuclease HARBI1 n=1 Tax=Molorchus minor TaxID=1323400 RepID=A0ABQ9J4A3_9CUCU|nr:hypothetical protein NQ317_005844 [Molorchus minor]
MGLIDVPVFESSSDEIDVPRMRNPKKIRARNAAIEPAIKLLLTLRFFASGSMLLTVGDFVGISKASACVAAKQVSQAIASLANQYIKMPISPEEKQAAKEKFYNIARMRVSLEKSKTIIVAAAVLHNLAIEENNNLPPEIQINDDEPDQPIMQQDVINSNNNNVRRNAIIQNHFANLL